MSNLSEKDRIVLDTVYNLNSILMLLDYENSSKFFDLYTLSTTLYFKVATYITEKYTLKKIGIENDAEIKFLAMAVNLMTELTLILQVDNQRKNHQEKYVKICHNLMNLYSDICNYIHTDDQKL